jgi:hypothetical protein
MAELQLVALDVLLYGVWWYARVHKVHGIDTVAEL